MASNTENVSIWWRHHGLNSKIRLPETCWCHSICREWSRLWLAQVFAYCLVPSHYMKLCDILLNNTLRPRQNGRHFADDIFKCPINNIPTLVAIMVWRRPGAKPLSESMMVSLLTHICVTRPQWDKLMSKSFCEICQKKQTSYFMIIHCKM